MLFVGMCALNFLLISLVFIITGSCTGDNDMTNKHPEPFIHQEIPALHRDGDVHKSLGPTDYAMYPKSLGKLRTAFVIFAP